MEKNLQETKISKNLYRKQKTLKKFMEERSYFFFYDFFTLLLKVVFI